MQSEQPLKPTYNLYLHQLLSNKQPKSCILMRLQTHTTIYHEGIEHKYITNLVVVGKNYIELYAIFQNQFILSMGTWELCEDILEVQQWDKCIVLVAEGKIVGVVYEDCMIKNAFMLSLHFLQSSSPITLIPDKSGSYMLISTQNCLLLCLSQKPIQRYKAKPTPHNKMSIIEQNIKWNRQEYQYIVDVIKFQFQDFQIGEVEGAHFCQQYLYFVGTGVSGTGGVTGGTGGSGGKGGKRVLYQIGLEKIFGENQREGLLMEFMKLDDDIIASYVIRRQNQCQFLLIKKNYSITIQNQKGQFLLDPNPLKQSSTSPSTSPPWTRKSSNPTIFPLHIIYNNILQIYQRSPAAGLSIPLYFNKKIIELPKDVQIQYCDVQDGILAYCNMYQVGVVFLRGGGDGKEKGDGKKIQKVVLRECFGSIIDFNIGQNILLIQNTFKTSCRLRLLRRSIAQSPKPFIMIPKKIALQKLTNTKSIHSLQQLLHHYQITQTEQQIKKIKQFLLNYLIIQTKNQGYFLYKLIEGPNYQKFISGFVFWDVVKIGGEWFGGFWGNRVVGYGEEANGKEEMEDGDGKGEFLFYRMDFSKGQFVFDHKFSNVDLYQPSKFPNISYPTPSTLPIHKIKHYIFILNQSTLCITCYNWQKNILTTIQLQYPIFTSFNINSTTTLNTNFNAHLNINVKRHITLRINYKSITFKKKDKDYFIVQVVGVVDGVKLVIWEVSVELGLAKLSHWTNNVGEGLAILYPADANGFIHQHQFRAISCPQYTLTDRVSQLSSATTPKILKMHTYTYLTTSYLLMITSSQQLLLYKKIYTQNSSPFSFTQSQSSSTLPIQSPLLSSQNLHNSATIGPIDIGFLYYRQPLQISIVKKFKYNQNNAFVDLGCGMLRVCNLVFYMGEMLEIGDGIRGCFRVEEGEVWGMMGDGKIRAVIADGSIVSHYLTTTIKIQLKEQLLGIQSTTQNYIIYSKNGFEVFDKQLNPTWSPTSKDPILQQNQHILTMCAYDHYIAISYYNYCLHDPTPLLPDYFTPQKSQLKSIKFKLRIYNAITKKKMLQKQSSFDQPILHIRYIPPDKLILVTSSNVSINTIKNYTVLENPKNRIYSKRGMLGAFCYYTQKVGIDPAYMMFGGGYGGMSFWVGNWIQKDKLDQMWFENVKDGVQDIQIFHYGDSLEMLKAIVADTSQNLLIFNLHPKQSQLLASVHLGSSVTSIKKRNELPFISTSDGNIRLLLPIRLKNPQISYLDFQQQLLKLIPMLGGFNTCDSRILNQRYHSYKLIGNVGVINGDLLKIFFSLSQVLKCWVCDCCEVDGVDAVKRDLLVGI